MKLEVGMYVRLINNNGMFGKIINGGIDDSDYVNIQFQNINMELPTYFIKKASHNIIDLIEKNDVVVDKGGDKYEVIDKVSDWKVIVNYLVLDTSTGEYFNKQLFKNDIAKVLTKEQFENYCYKIGDE